MATDGFDVSIDGADDLKKRLLNLPKKIRAKALSGALRKAGQVISREAKRRAPVLMSPRSGRKAGTMRKAISVRASKKARREGNVGVYVSVRPLSKSAVRKFKAGGGLSGEANPNDPYYWSWVHFGHKYVPRKRKAGGAHGGVTVYKQRLRDGRIVTRKKKFSGDSITGRRRSATKFVKARPFFNEALSAKGREAIDVAVAHIIPEIERLNTQ